VQPQRARQHENKISPEKTFISFHFILILPQPQVVRELQDTQDALSKQRAATARASAEAAAHCELSEKESLKSASLTAELKAANAAAADAVASATAGADQAIKAATAAAERAAADARQWQQQAMNAFGGYCSCDVNHCIAFHSIFM
jgi:hypothetical protein